MSKKMLKRSLALGALMAFVITGSAMAAELTIEYDNGTYTATGTGIQGSLEVKEDDDGLYTGLKNVNWAGSLNVYSGGVWETPKESYGNFTGNAHSGNVVKITGGNYDRRIIAGYSNSADANNNTVYFEGSAAISGEYEKPTHTITSMVLGGWGWKNANGNIVYVSSAEVNTAVYAGDAQNGNSNYNVIEIKDKSKVSFVAGGTARDANGNGNATNNKVTISDSEVYKTGDTGVWGGIVHGSGDAVENEVIVNDTFINKVYIVGGHSSYGDATDNKITINGESTVVDGEVFGGREQYGEGTANNNIVTINAGTIKGVVYGGAGSESASAKTTAADGNIVNLNGGTIENKVYGGHTGSRTSDAPIGTTNNNTVNISGETVLANATLIGGNVTGSTGNTLNIGDGWSGKIKSVQNFNTVNFGKGSAVTVTNGMKLGTGTTINLADGDDYTGGNYAINGTLTVNSDEATLTIGNIKEATYNIASGYEGTNKWVLEDALMQVEQEDDGTVTGWDIGANGVKVTVEAKKADQMAADTGISESTAGLVTEIIQNANNQENTSAQKAAVEFIQNVVDANGSDPTAVGAAINAATKMGEAGGNSATAASIVKNVTGVTNDRLSFNCGHSAPHKGGHGVGLFEEGSGADIWVEYVHGKDEVEDMPSTAGKTSYEGQYNGIVMGVDFKKVNKFQSGIAFNYGEGDTNSLGSSVRTHSDYDFWGVGYYGNIHNDDSNVIFDINYAKTDSDVTQYNSGSTLEASPETTTWSAGVKLEKLYQNENVQIVPYTGLRYMSIDADDYSTKKGEFYYSMDRQDIWLLPVGVSIRQEVANDNGWTVSPRVDLSYIWAFGDTNSNMEVKSPFPGVSQIGYDVMDDGSFLGLVGIEAHKGQWGYGVAYSYQKGDHSESKKWYVDVKYSF